MVRYLRLLHVQLKASLLLGLQYRYDFLIDSVISAFWTLTAIVPLVIVYRLRPSVAGWSFPEALIVVGFFTLLQGVLEGAINPSLTSVVEHIRKGTLDFVLLKPADAQFLVSTSKFQPWRAVNLIASVAIFFYAFQLRGTGPGARGILSAVVMLGLALVVLYSLWILVISAAFYVVRIDNLSYLFSAVFDAGRWPISVFRGMVRILFTFVIPLATMTTFPAEALLGRLTLDRLLLSILGASLLAVFSRHIWLRSIRQYTSASS